MIGSHSAYSLPHVSPLASQPLRLPQIRPIPPRANPRHHRLPLGWLAAHHQAKANAALSEKKHASAGHYLRSAVDHLENGAKWAGHKLESGATATANGVRTVAGKLFEGSGFVLDEAGKGVKWVGEEVETLGKKLEPRKNVEPGGKSATLKK